MKLNIIKIRKLKIKICYFYEKKNHLQKLFTKNNKDTEKMNREIRKKNILKNYIKLL